MKRFVAMAIAGALLLAACGGSDNNNSAKGKTTSTSAASTSPTNAPSTALGNGVSADTIKVAVALVDFKCIQQFVDDVRLDQEKIYGAYFNDINEHGGINGRRIVPVFKTYCPIPGATPSSLNVCTSATEDDNVFAIMGVFVDFTGDAQLCVARDKKRVLITHGLDEAQIKEAPPGLMLSPDIATERRTRVIFDLLEKQGRLKNKKVAILASDDDKARITTTVDPELKKLKVERGSDGVLSITGSDTSAAQAQLDSFIEKWKEEGTNAIVILGETTSAKQFVEKIKSELPKALLITDTTTILGEGQDLVRAGTKPNPYDGMITAEGETGAQHVKGANYKRCAQIYQEQLHKQVPGPNDVVKAPNGKRNDIYGTVSDACSEVTMFLDIATKAGKTLNDDTWRQAVDSMGKMRIASTKYASLHAGKYDADDTYGLVAFDSSIPKDGDWKQLTPPKDVSGLG
jgi:hypothetical protein